MGNNKASLIKNVASLGIVQVANYVLPLLYLPIVSRIIGPDKFGVINYATSFVYYFYLVISYGFDLSATRRLAKDADNVEFRRIVFSEVFYSQIFLLLLSTGMFLCFLYIVPPLAAEKEVAIFSFSICIATTLTQNWMFQAMQDLPKVAILNFVSKLLFTVFVLMVIRQKQDYVWQPLLMSGIQIFVAVISFIWAYKRYHLKFIKIPLRQVFGLLWAEKTVCFSLIVMSLYTTTNTVILGLYQSSEQVGYFTAAQKLILVFQSVINVPLAQAFYPFIARAFADSKQGGIIMVQKFIPVIWLFTAGIGFFMLAFGPIFMKWFYGSRFEPSIPVFMIMVFVPMLIALSNTFGVQVMLNLKLDRSYFIINAIGAAFSIGLNLIMVKQWGYVGSAINWLFTEFLIALGMFIALYINGVKVVNGNSFKPSVLWLQIRPVLNKITRKG